VPQAGANADAPPTAPAARAAPLIVLLSIAFGLVFLVRNATDYLAPFLVADLHLGARHIGLLSATFALAWAASGWLVPALMTHTAATRHWLPAAVFMTALSCFGSWLADGFGALLACRVLAGAAGGPALPLIQGAVARELGTQHRGLHMGLIQGLGGSLIAAILGPLAVIPMGQQLGWRTTMLLLAAGISVLAIVLRLTLPPLSGHNAPGSTSDASGNTATATERRRNLLLCCAIGGLLVGWLVLNVTFFPLYLYQVKQLDADSIGFVMSCFGAGSFAGVLVLPALSDRWSRRATLVIGAGIGLIAPLALLQMQVLDWRLSALVFIGSFAGGCFPLFLAVVPSESVAPARIAASVGLVQAWCEIAGGVIAPACLGWLGDRVGLQAPIIASLLACPMAAVLALLLRDDRTVVHLNRG